MQYNRDPPTGRELTDLVCAYVRDSVRARLPQILDTEDEPVAQMVCRAFFPEEALEALVIEERTYRPPRGQPLTPLRRCYEGFLFRLVSVYPQHAGGHREAYALKEPKLN